MRERRKIMRRDRIDLISAAAESEKRQKRGAGFTYFSFLAALAFLIFFKASNPGASILRPAATVAGVALGCIVLRRISRRIK